MPNKTDVSPSESEMADQRIIKARKEYGAKNDIHKQVFTLGRDVTVKGFSDRGNIQDFDGEKNSYLVGFQRSDGYYSQWVNASFIKQ